MLALPDPGREYKSFVANFHSAAMSAIVMEFESFLVACALHQVANIQKYHPEKSRQKGEDAKLCQG